MKNPSAEKLQRVFSDAVAKMQQGDVAGAAAGFEKLTKVAADNAVVWYNLGLSYSHLQRHTKAVAAYNKVIRLAPKHVDAVVNLGLSQHELKEPEEAMKNAKLALSHAPQHARALNLLGTLHAEKNEHAAAGEAFHSALASDPHNIDARHNLANSRLQSGDAESALQILEPLLSPSAATSNAASSSAASPDSFAPEKRYRMLHGQILLELKRYDEASEVVRELSEQYEKDPEVMRLKMSLHELAKDYFGVIEIAQEIIEDAPDHTSAKATADVKIDIAHIWNSLGSAYFQLDSIPRAAECYETAITLHPEHAEYHSNRGLAHSSVGEKSAAEDSYRKALALNPMYAEAHRNLVALKKFSSVDDADAKAIIQLWQQDDLDDFNRTKLAFALGKVYDDVGEYSSAFTTYEVGNQLKFSEASMDFGRYFSHIDAVAEVFTEPPAIVASTDDKASTPIFILGMPRSGTTLVEQILSRHPKVSGCGELPCIEKAIARLEKRSEPMCAYPWEFKEIKSERFSEERQEYISWVNRLHDLKTDFFTDKMPFNFVHLWLIKALFPDASIVHCHRHPLDVIISNYFQLYASDVSFVYDLQVLAKYYVRYYRLMQHWREVFGEAIYKVQYEVLVGDKEAETKQLIDAVKLPWDDACLDLKKSETAVRTASIWQVRQGIYTTSRERWRNYESELAPAIEILQAEKVLDAELKETN